MSDEEMCTRFAIGRNIVEEGDNQADLPEGCVVSTAGLGEDWNDGESILKTLGFPSLRDQFAMAALTGLLERSDADQTYRGKLWLTRSAYEFADAMLEARMPKGNEE